MQKLTFPSIEDNTEITKRIGGCMNNLNKKALLDRAIDLGFKAELITNSKKHYRRHSSLGSTSVPQKVITLDGDRCSIGSARQRLDAREMLFDNALNNL